MANVVVYDPANVVVPNRATQYSVNPDVSALLHGRI